jgi:hypothetical protein
LHRRWFECFEVDQGALVATETVRDARDLELRMRLQLRSMLVALSAAFVGIKRFRDAERGGGIKFWPAFGLAVAISLVASVFYVVVWELVLLVTDFAKTFGNAMIEKKRAAGVGGEALAQAIAGMHGFSAMYAKPWYRMPMTFAEIFPLGILVSLVSAALLRNPRFLPARG